MEETKFIIKDKHTIGNYFILTHLFPVYRPKYMLTHLGIIFILLSIVGFLEIDLSNKTFWEIPFYMIFILMFSLIMVFFTMIAFIEFMFITYIVLNWKVLNTTDLVYLNDDGIQNINDKCEIKIPYASIERFTKVGNYFFITSRFFGGLAVCFNEPDKGKAIEIEKFLKQKIK